MKVKILEVTSERFVNGIIRKGEKKEMPSMQTGWVFNFDKHIKINNSTAYVLVLEKTPTVLEGCFIFELRKKEQPYLAYIEIAPHNKGNKKQYDFVAGCMIAFACKLSIEKGLNYHKGFLTLDVMEEKQANQVKLMALYSKKYKAKAINEKNMVIIPNDGKWLIEQYLER